MSLLPALDKLTSKTPEIAALRKRAGQYFREHGLPSRKHEDWRYTSLKSLNDQPYLSTLLEETLPSHHTLSALSKTLNPSFSHLVFINGRLDRTLSSVDELPDGVKWSTDVLAEDFADAFEALSVASLGQGLTLNIPADVALTRPLQIHFHTASELGPALMVNPRVSIHFGAGAKGNVIESYSSASEAKSFQNSQTEITIGEKAEVTFVRMQEEGLRATHVGRTRITAMAGAKLTHLAFSSGAAVSRHNFELLIKGEGIEAHVLGAVVGTGAQHFDQSTMIDHQIGASMTNQVYNSLLDGESRSVFSGKIRIRPHAQKANSNQLNKNLLLSDKAEADSLPMMMIEADDVKAGHGATVGQLNAEELFYLKSRGLSDAIAIPLLAGGFILSVTDQLTDETLRAWLKTRLNLALTRLNVGAP